MDNNEIKSLIVSILEEMTETNTIAEPKERVAEPIHSKAESQIEEGVIDDITEVDIRKQFLIPNPVDRDGYLKMKAKTPARLGLWRSGPRYKTQSMLRFRADHAAAQDAVFSYVSDDLIKEMNFIEAATKCQDKDEYVTRPDLGRQFDEENTKKIKENVKPNQKVQVIVGDGLSSAAIEANIKEILPSIKQGLKMFNLDFDSDSVVFIKHARVPAMDQIAELTGAEVVCYLIGERPGLVTAESMSAYIAYKPTVGMPEARRTVISNIHKGGTPAVEAGAYIAELIHKMLEHKKSGIDLKEVE
ncbi:MULTISPECIES: ethanolamine ammonia-lyase subunit EutC [unclassified Enterococcus]|uniref:ethanolamine ammonia-lyase subunit EutC n=1 Tax=unclassified Enterococcus TaxID=2608891 RepID=UPI001CE226F8|nr:MULTISPECIES: ethanolamine ammonia-lyase subunit EutC [unclassified Enterococcus]MCA5013484.1 ethanolamine ammonia-lyase subunit EutC [Enterococcus sp. S23]MCA5016734.1 ethanolamine ammonia-lyase subunit EutC [Enterococcus sp. S22(2020)]